MAASQDGPVPVDSAASECIGRVSTTDWSVERNGFEPAVPFLDFLTTTLDDGFHNGRLSPGCSRIGTESSNPLRSGEQAGCSASASGLHGCVKLMNKYCLRSVSSGLAIRI